MGPFSGTPSSGAMKPRLDSAPRISFIGFILAPKLMIYLADRLKELSLEDSVEEHADRCSKSNSKKTKMVRKNL